MLLTSKMPQATWKTFTLKRHKTAKVQQSCSRWLKTTLLTIRPPMKNALPSSVIWETTETRKFLDAKTLSYSIAKARLWSPRWPNLLEEETSKVSRTWRLECVPALNLKAKTTSSLLLNARLCWKISEVEKKEKTKEQGTRLLSLAGPWWTSPTTEPSPSRYTGSWCAERPWYTRKRLREPTKLSPSTTEISGLPSSSSKRTPSSMRWTTPVPRSITTKLPASIEFSQPLKAKD